MLELRSFVLLAIISLAGIAPAVAAQGQRPSTAVYASQAGAQLDSDLSKGGGTDDTAVLQRILDRAKNGRGVHLVIDGPALIAGLDVHSNTTIECTAGGGFYLKDYTARAVIRNAHRSRGAVTDKNISLRGCFINGNRKNQVIVGPANSSLRIHQEPDGSFRSGLQFFGVHHLTLEDLIVSDTYSWGTWVANAKFIHVQNVTVRREFFVPFPEGGDTPQIRAWYKENGWGVDKWGGADDGMHFNGPIQYLTIDGAKLYTWDDGISLTANDHDTDDLTVHNVLGPYVGQGPITDVVISNVIFMGSHHAIRMLSGNQRFDRVVVSNVTGTIRERFAVISPFIIPSPGNFGSITFSNINVELAKYPSWPELFPEKGWQKLLDDHYRTLAAGQRAKSDPGEEMEIPLFSLNGRIENLNLNNIAVKVVDRNRPIIRVGHTSDIQVMNVDMTVRDPAAQSIPVKLMGKIGRLNMSLDWPGKEPIQYKSGSIGQLNRKFDEASYSPYAGQNYPTNVYWGDTHLHTSLSWDANYSGNRLGPEDAYRFAQGHPVRAQNGMLARLRRPLDFLVVADHAENLAVRTSLQHSDPALLATKDGRALYQDYKKVSRSASRKNEGVLDRFFVTERVVKDDEYLRTIWSRVVKAADDHNQPGKFTAFSGFEWTYNGSSPNGGNLHRVVIFKDSRDKTARVKPFSVYDSKNPEDLWRYLMNYEDETGGEVLAIPHNGNLSNGEMFALSDFAGRELTRAYAQTRSRWEPLFEITQIKGDSETHPVLSPTDEFADFERWNFWSGRTYEGIRTDGWEKRKASEYARSALKLGLDQLVRLGVNPFKFGVIGSTDAHTSLATADENNFWGKLSSDEPHSGRIARKPWGWETSASGYAAVWATGNSREALFAAMRRKETYATTGPRMTVRFFGGWSYAPEDAFKPDLALIGYRKGVPMGGDLTQARAGKAPQFLIRAVKDPDGANLDRVQVIKGWRDAQGELHERIYNVALADGRKEGPRGEAPPVGSTVDVANATYTNAIGDPELAVVWTDPDFDAGELAFYYVRVLEIPTPRWTAYDAKYFGIKDIPAEIPLITQERAYTSPIWFAPETK